MFILLHSIQWGMERAVSELWILLPREWRSQEFPNIIYIYRGYTALYIWIAVSDVAKIVQNGAPRPSGRQPSRVVARQTNTNAWMRWSLFAVCLVREPQMNILDWLPDGAWKIGCKSGLKSITRPPFVFTVLLSNSGTPIQGCFLHYLSF